MKKLAPDLERALLFEGLPGNIEAVLTNKREAGFHPDLKILNETISSQAKKLGYKIRPWVANQQLDIERLAKMGVDVIMTDFPEKALMILKDLESK